MSNITGLEVKSLRIGVESVEVELDEDSGILWTSLQTAFPGCSGMYYRENGDSCKKSVRFDGKKFIAPGGAWNDREYFVTLSQRCHSATGNPGHTASYSEATKQFEKSVQAVQKMMMASGMKIDMSHLTKKRQHTSSRDTVSTTSSSTVTPDPIQAIDERSKLLKNAGRELSPLEQQFLDLCRISTAKDQIIDANRQEISKLNEKLRSLEKNLKETEAELTEANGMIECKQQELDMVSEALKRWEESRTTISELNQKSGDLEENVTELQMKLMNLEEENQGLKANLETSQNRIKEMSDSISMLTSSKEILAKELDQLRPFAESAGIEDYENIPTFINAVQENKELQKVNERMRMETEESKENHKQMQTIHSEVFEENAKLRNRNEDLERRFAHVDDELACVNENWAKELKEKQQDWDKIKYAAESEVLSLREQLVHLQSILESATREAAENARRVSELEHERHEIRRLSDAVHIKTQEDLTRQIRILKERLAESDSQVAELNVLVSSLAADATASRREISDLL
uniref:TDP43_N domain-containing protein n=1 Tax=Caenorhabditis tropicalis TaxID=1561998 RepID=A0A1I7TVB6_9PELO